MTNNPLAMPKSIDDSRLLFDEMLVVTDALRKWSNPHGLSWFDMPSDPGKAVFAVICKCNGNPLHTDELIKQALIVVELNRLNTNAVELERYVKDRQVEFKSEGAQTDAVVATCAARIRQAAHTCNTEQGEDQALRDVTANPTPKTREAYADAIRATNAAHNEAPSRRRSTADILKTVRQRQLDSQGKSAVGIETPLFHQLSHSLCGWRGLILLAAMPGIGKTTLATAAAIDAVESNEDTCAVFVSFEMPTETLVERTRSQMSGIGQRTLRLGDNVCFPNGRVHLSADESTVELGMRLDDEQMSRLHQADGRLLALDGRLVFVGKSDIGTLGGRSNDMRGCLAKIERLVVETKQRSGASRSFVVLDHFGAIPVDSPDGRLWPNDTERARYLLGGLITLRDRLGEDNPIVVVAQCRKADNNKEKPGIESVMGTADSGYAADAVILFRREKEDDANRKPTDPVDIIANIEKGRDMMLRGEIRLQLDPMTSRIKEVDA